MIMLYRYNTHGNELVQFLLSYQIDLKVDFASCDPNYLPFLRFGACCMKKTLEDTTVILSLYFKKDSVQAGMYTFTVNSQSIKKTSFTLQARSDTKQITKSSIGQLDFTQNICGVAILVATQMKKGSFVEIFTMDNISNTFHKLIQLDINTQLSKESRSFISNSATYGSKLFCLNSKGIFNILPMNWGKYVFTTAVISTGYSSGCKVRKQLEE